MSIKRLLLFILLNACAYNGWSQQRLVARVVNSQGIGIDKVWIEYDNTATDSDSLGYFFINVSTSIIQIRLSHLNYETKQIEINRSEIPVNWTITLLEKVQVLDEVSVEERRYQSLREQAGMTPINPIQALRLPTAFGEFNKVLATLPGVVSNNELSSAYAVRGGNFDENLVYVNDIEIYRPFLIRAGQQEGLSFVNTDLVESVDFSSGGWQAKYGDKLSSSLNIQYKNPKKAGGSATLSLLGAALHAENKINERVSFVTGVRHKRSTYLLNTLETQGEYLPNFTDIQAYITIDPDKDPTDKLEKDTEISILLAYSRNRYLVKPENRTTDFGSFNQAFRLFVAFDGRELMEYDTYQTGVKLTQKFNRKLQSSIIVSLMHTLEREYLDLEGGYRLCDVDKNTGSRTFNECVAIRGIGTQYTFARNRLRGQIWSAENRNHYLANENHKLEWGVGIVGQNIHDFLNEYAFIDSADFVKIQYTLNSDYQLNAFKTTAFIQHTWLINEQATLHYGLRALHWSLNGQFLLSPRVQFSVKPGFKKDVLFRSAIGLYHQPPVYRELRNYQGQINEQIKAQSSLHVLAGIDHQMILWGRTFKMVSEAYYKRLTNVIPYDVDNVRIRYFGENVAKAYAVGADFRLNGEFIEGVESWFSLGLMSTKENIDNDGKGYIRRPSDQRINVAVLFQDQLPNNPSVRLFLNLLYGSGLPFGPPNDPEQRSIFNGRSYTRADIGFSKEFDFSDRAMRPFMMNSLWITAEVLNLFANNNVISYTWISDVNNSTFAVPNALSARFLNLKLIARF